jgi:enamine deaminase RidA (YjgF/YER057c/UK114 family)
VSRRPVPTPALCRHVRNGALLYHHVIETHGGRTIYIGGQLAGDKNGTLVGKGDMGAQIRQVCENIRLALAAAGADIRHLVKTNTYVTDIDEFFKFIDVRNAFFGGDPPVSTTVEVRRLAGPDFLVEIDAR